MVLAQSTTLDPSPASVLFFMPLTVPATLLHRRAVGSPLIAVPIDDDMAGARKVLQLAKQYLPVAVEFDGQITDNDWRLVGPGLVGGAASILESILRLPPPQQTPGAEILTRSLADYVITFAWLAVPDARDERLNLFEAHEFAEREGLDEKFTIEFQGKTQAKPKRSEPSERQKLIAHYKKLINAGKMPSDLLTNETRAWIKERRKIVGTKPMPVLLDRAFQADAYWIEHSEAIACHPLGSQWVLVFGRYSAIAHASPTAVSRVASARGGVLSVGESTPDSIKSTPYSVATVLVGLMLHIASQSLGWPSEEELDAALRPAGRLETRLRVLLVLRRPVVHVVGTCAFWSSSRPAGLMRCDGRERTVPRAVRLRSAQIKRGVAALVRDLAAESGRPAIRRPRQVRLTSLRCSFCRTAFLPAVLRQMVRTRGRPR